MRARPGAKGPGARPDVRVPGPRAAFRARRGPWARGLRPLPRCSGASRRLRQRKKHLEQFAFVQGQRSASGSRFPALRALLTPPFCRSRSPLPARREGAAARFLRGWGLGSADAIRHLVENRGCCAGPAGGKGPFLFPLRALAAQPGRAPRIPAQRGARRSPRARSPASQGPEVYARAQRQGTSPPVRKMKC